MMIYDRLFMFVLKYSIRR